ncbi:MAG: hypothetical protein ACYCQI_12175 [Gammaproteobacteria bacterium]
MSTWIDMFVLDFSEKYYNETVPFFKKSSAPNLSLELNTLKLVFTKSNKDPILATLAQLMYDKVMLYYHKTSTNEVLYNEIFDRDLTYLLSSVFPRSETNPLLDDFKGNYQRYLDNYGLYEVISIKPHSNLINDLIFTMPPDIDDQLIFKKRLFYMDFPDGCLKINNIDIKSLFVDDKHIVAVGNYKSSGCMFAIKDSVTMRIYSNMPEEIVFDSIEAIHNLARLLVLYFDSDQKKYCVNNAIDRSKFSLLDSKKKRAKIKKFSLFKFIYMERPSDDKSWRKNTDSLKTWNLTHKLQVKGHWRWQPYGEKMAKRKLIWIEEYVKGVGNFDQKIRMEVLG